jgi:hypothetical protein
VRFDSILVATGKEVLNKKFIEELDVQKLIAIEEQYLQAIECMIMYDSICVCYQIQPSYKSLW